MLRKSISKGPTTVPLLTTTIGESLQKTVLAYPSNPCLITPKTTISYNEFYKQTGNLTKSLMKLGFKKGDKLGIWSMNSVEWVLTQYATARAGVIMVALNPSYKHREIEYAINLSECKGVMFGKGYRDTVFGNVLKEIDTPGIEFKIKSEEVYDLVRDGAKSDLDLRAVEKTLFPDDPINIQFTSGTTGSPKAALLSHKNILNNGYFTGLNCGYTPNDRVCIPVPFYHCFGMVLGNLACTSTGAAMVIPGERFDPKQVLDIVEKERCTSLYGVPTMMISLLEYGIEKYDLKSLRTGVMAGSTCPITLMKDVMGKMNMKDVTIAYGMTETSPISTQTLPSNSIKQKTETVGRVHPHVEVKIVNGAGDIVDVGERGELCTRGYSVMKGYYNNAKATQESIKDGWMLTGDLAVMDNEGFVSIVGRIKDLIIRGGENIYPREIEEFLHQHNSIVEASVIGIPSEKYGEEVVAWVKLKNNTGKNVDEMLKGINDFCHDGIARYKIPKHFIVVNEFPMTVTGKIQKFVMRQETIKRLNPKQSL